MSGRTKQSVAIAVLLAGNLVLWSFYALSGRADVRFDFAGFEREVRAALPEAKFDEQNFEPGPMIPEGHLHLFNEADKQALWSVYVGYYPAQGLLREPPHDPRLCYQSQGWSIVAHGEPRRFEFEEGHALIEDLRVERTLAPEEVESVSTSQKSASRPVKRLQPVRVRLRVYHGFVEGTPGDPALWTRSWRRLSSGRSDVAWVRVEVLDDPRADQLDLEAILRPVWRASLRGIRGPRSGQ